MYGDAPAGLVGSGSGSGGRHAFGPPLGAAAGGGSEGSDMGMFSAGEAKSDGDYGGLSAGHDVAGSYTGYSDGSSQVGSEDFSKPVTRRPGDMTGLAGGRTGNRRTNSRQGKGAGSARGRSAGDGGGSRGGRPSSKGHNPTMDPSARKEAETFALQEQIRVFMALKSQEAK